MNPKLEILSEYLTSMKKGGIRYVPFKAGVVQKGFSGKAPGDLGSLEEEVRSCKRCGLNRARHNAVFGEGKPDAVLMFVGEAPGKDEDLTGKPFVGAAGQLLTKIIEAMGFKREDVYIANVLKCRPPNNRDPEKEEIAICREYLAEQIKAVKPKIICALGKFAFQTLLNVETGIMKARGKFYKLGGIKVMPTYHPSFLLRNPSEKRAVWEDMKLVKAEYEKIIEDGRGK